MNEGRYMRDDGCGEGWVGVGLIGYVTGFFGWSPGPFLVCRYTLPALFFCLHTVRNNPPIERLSTYLLDTCAQLYGG